ncbi:hypothetical protein Tco_0684417, partial [Tanacetum coccineum]
MSSSSKSSRDYSRKHRRAILKPWKQSHNLSPSPPSPPPNRTPPTSPITTNSLSSPLPPHNPTQNQIAHELHHLSNLLEINLQQAIEATNPSPLTSPRIPPPTLDQVNFHLRLCHWELIKKDKGKKVMSSKDPEEVNTESDFNDETTHASGSMKIEEEAKVEAARRKGEIRKEELFDLLGPEVVNKYYNDKLQEDDTSETIPEFKASDLHLGEWREVVTTFLNKKDRLNDLANEKRKHADDIHDFLRANKRLKSSVKYKDHPTYTVLNEPVL